jgi:hypothetical protein
LARLPASGTLQREARDAGGVAGATHDPGRREPVRAGALRHVLYRSRATLRRRWGGCLTLVVLVIPARIAGRIPTAVLLRSE